MRIIFHAALFGTTITLLVADLISIVGLLIILVIGLVLDMNIEWRVKNEIRRSE